MSANDRFHRDKRVIAARKQYRTDLKAGIPERAAWAKADAVYSLVHQELGIEPVTLSRDHQLSRECWCDPQVEKPTNRCYILFVGGNWSACCEQRPCTKWGSS